MQIPLQVALGLAIASGYVAAGRVSPQPISLERRHTLIAKNDELDIEGLKKHLKYINKRLAVSLENFRNNTGDHHPLFRHVKGLLDKRGDQSGEIELKDINKGLMWAGQVEFGGQKMYVDFDTGSADTLVNPTAYDPHKSQSSKNTHKPFQTAYGDGTKATGTIFTDKFSIGGLSAENVAIGRSDVEFLRGEDPNQGISGMAFPAIQAFPKENPPFFVSLMKQKKVAQGVFQFTIKAGSGSSLHLGGVDKSKFSDSLTWANVDPGQGFWLTDAEVNGQKIKAIWDTGSTIISGPMDQVRRLFSQSPELTPFSQGDQLFALFDCSRTPKLTFTVSGKQFQLGRDQTRYGKQQGKCVFTVVGQSGLPMDAWIVGDSFFMATSVVFDMEKNRIGFAKQSGNSSSSSGGDSDSDPSKGGDGPGKGGDDPSKGGNDPSKGGDGPSKGGNDGGLGGGLGGYGPDSSMGGGDDGGFGGGDGDGWGSFGDDGFGNMGGDDGFGSFGDDGFGSFGDDGFGDFDAWSQRQLAHKHPKNKQHRNVTNHRRFLHQMNDVRII